MQTLRFLHIPKTAGTTLVHILRVHYRFQQHFAFSGDADADAERYRALAAQDRKRIALFSGHAPIETGLDRPDASTTITMLRDPVARVQSFCKHVMEGKSPYLLAQYPPDRFDLDEFLWGGTEELFNLQTKMLVNRRHCSVLWPAHLSDSQVMESATSNLFNRVAHFGIQEHFKESIARFRVALGWRPVLYSRRNRARTARQLVFGEHHVKRIMELNRLDLELYRIARTRFIADRDRQRLARPSPIWARAASIFRLSIG